VTTIIIWAYFELPYSKESRIWHTKYSLQSCHQLSIKNEGQESKHHYQKTELILKVCYCCDMGHEVLSAFLSLRRIRDNSFSNIKLTILDLGEKSYLTEISHFLFGTKKYYYSRQTQNTFQMSWYQYSTCEKARRGNTYVNIPVNLGLGATIWLQRYWKIKGVPYKQKTRINLCFHKSTSYL